MVLVMVLVHLFIGEIDSTAEFIGDGVDDSASEIDYCGDFIGAINGGYDSDSVIDGTGDGIGAFIYW